MADGAAAPRAAARVLAPARPQLAEALACVTNVAATEWAKAIGWGSPSRIELGERDALTLWAPRGPGRGSTLTITDPAEAWEALATRGVIPESWVGDAGRAFRGLAACYCDDEELTGGGASLCGLCRGIEQVRATPWTVAACVALAADVGGVTQAEALAREAVARLAPWGAPSPQRIVWRVVDPATWEWTRPEPLWRARYSFGATHDGVVADNAMMERIAGVHRRTALWIAGHHGDAADWNANAARGAVIERQADMPAALVGRRFADVPNPFAPLVDLWALGYALDALTDDAVVLVAPNLDSEEGR